MKRKLLPRILAALLFTAVLLVLPIAGENLVIAEAEAE